MTTQNTAPRFTVVPPGPVSDRTRVQLRLAVPNVTGKPETVIARLYWDKADDAHLLTKQTLSAPPKGFAYASAWWETKGRAGKRRLLYRVESGGKVREGVWPMEVIASKTPGLPYLQGAWIESFAALRCSEGESDQETERNMRHHIDAMHQLGMNTLIIAYLEYRGTFFYRSSVRFFDRDINQTVDGKDCKFDVLETILSQADKNKMQVFLGIGRGGDTYLLWQFDKPDWAKRNAEAVALGKRVIQELWDKYGHHPSFYGWYFTHEMNDLARANAYYNPLADFCHSLSPDKPTLAAPAGTPIITRQSLAESHVDIFAYQDAVGSGYVPYKNTFNPESRMAMLDEIYTRYRDWHAGTDKHFWSDLEIWEMDGSQGYGGAYPPAFSRVKRQIEKEAQYAPMLTGYAWFGYLHPPTNKAKFRDPRALRLYEDYANYLKAQRPRRPDDGRGQ